MYVNLTPEQAALLQPDLDLAALDELLGLLPAEVWPLILGSLQPLVPPVGVDESTARELSGIRRLESDDPNLQAIIDRVYIGGAA